MIEIDTIYGNLAIDVPEGDLIRKSLEEYGEWGLLECYFAARILEPGYRAIDVGAFVGTFSLGLSMFGAGSLVSVEPNPLILPSLKKNLAAHCAIPYHLVEQPLGIKSSGNWVLSIAEENMGASHLVQDDAKGHPVQILELNELRHKYGNYDFLKLDAEGHEQDIIESDKDYIAKECQVLFIEQNDDSNHDKLVEFLFKNQFHVYVAIFSAFNRNNYKASMGRLFSGGICEANIIATRKPIHMGDDLQMLGCALLPVHNIEELRQACLCVPRWGYHLWENMSSTELTGLVGHLITSLRDKDDSILEHIPL